MTRITFHAGTDRHGPELDLAEAIARLAGAPRGALGHWTGATVTAHADSPYHDDPGCSAEIYAAGTRYGSQAYPVVSWGSGTRDAQEARIMGALLTRAADAAELASAIVARGVSRAALGQAAEATEGN